MQGQDEDLERLQHLLQQEVDSQSLLARIQQGADLTTEQAAIVLEALRPGAQPEQAALSLPATLQRLVAASCKFEAVALVAFEVDGKAQQHAAAASGEAAASHDIGLPGKARDAAATRALQAAREAVAGVSVAALAHVKDSNIATKASGSSHARDPECTARIRPVHAVVSCLESSADGEQTDAPWSREDFRSALATTRDQAWTQFAEAGMAVAASGSSHTSSDPATLALVDAMASIAPMQSSSSPTR